MNFLRNPLAATLSTVKSTLFRNVSRGDGVLGKPLVKEIGCIYSSNLGADGRMMSVSTRSYGTLRTLLPNTLLTSSLGGALASMSSSLSKPLLLNSDLTGSNAGSSQITPGSFYIQTRGMKFKGRVKRRCKDCFLRWINGMLYNLCKTHPRHKHGLKPAYFCNQRILTHATMSQKRPW